MAEIKNNTEKLKKANDLQDIISDLEAEIATFEDLFKYEQKNENVWITINSQDFEINKNLFDKISKIYLEDKKQELQNLTNEFDSLFAK